MRIRFGFVGKAGVVLLAVAWTSVASAGGGWEPYPTKEDFIRHLDTLQAAEKTGEIRIVTYDEISDLL